LVFILGIWLPSWRPTAGIVAAEPMSWWLKHGSRHGMPRRAAP